MEFWIRPASMPMRIAQSDTITVILEFSRGRTIITSAIESKAGKKGLSLHPEIAMR